MNVDGLNTLPWHEQQWMQIRKMYSQDRMPHALLLEGQQGLGKEYFSKQLMQMLLCQESTSSELKYCQTCASCVWIEKGGHPDYLNVSPEEGKKLISVESIRNTIQIVQHTSHQSGNRLIIINPADCMTVEASNSLLKTLEEPPVNTFLFLLSDKPANLLPTIRSRVTRIKFFPPKESQSVAWLKAQGLDEKNAKQLLLLGLGAPLRFGMDIDEIKALIHQTEAWWDSWIAMRKKTITVLDLAKQWKAAEPNMLLIWLDALFRSMVMCKLLEDKVPENSLFPDLLGNSVQVPVNALYRLRDRVLSLLRKGQTSLNWGLQLEALAIECQTLYR